MSGFAQGIVLKERNKVILKLPIVGQVTNYSLKKFNFQSASYNTFWVLTRN